MSQIHEPTRAAVAQVRLLGSARSGAKEGALLRATSVALILLAIGFVWLVLTLLPLDYNGVRSALGHPLPAIALTLFVATGILHMQIGMRSILLDYIHGAALEWALMLNLFFCALLAAICVYSVLRIGFV